MNISDARAAMLAEAAIREMHRQVGELRFDENGLALRGVLVRHLVMPGGLAGCLATSSRKK